MSNSEGGPKQVDDPDYHSVNHTAAQTCGWTKNALTGRGKCYKNVFYRRSRPSASGSYGNRRFP